jgi:recombinational DNA repair protein RecR
MDEELETPDCCRRSFAASIKDTAKRLLEDPTVAPRSVVNARLKICESCDRYTSKKTCEICQCFMPLKTTMANMTCPIDLWKEWTKDAN